MERFLPCTMMVQDRSELMDKERVTVGIVVSEVDLLAIFTNLDIVCCRLISPCTVREYSAGTQFEKQCL